MILPFQVCFPVEFEKAYVLSACLLLQMVPDADRRNGEEKQEAEYVWGVAAGKSCPLGTGIRSQLWMNGKQEFCFIKMCF